jgi:tripartite ATP-independent transporter DctP family solute receptor
MKTMKKVISVSMMVACVLLLMVGCESKGVNSNPEVGDDKTITFKMAIVDNETTPYYKGAKKIAEEVAAATDNKIQIEVIAGGALGGERDTVELAMDNNIDIVTAANSVLTNWIPEMSILDQAYIWENAEQAHAAVDGPVGDLIEAKASKLGLHVIGYMESGFRNVFSKAPIVNTSDFKGVKIRTMQNEYHMAAFESFGAMPTAMSANEQFTALQQGTIDACENAISNCYSNGYYEVTKNITYTNHAFVYILICMSDNAWNKIPVELQQPFLDAVQRGYNAQREYLVEANTEAEVKLKEAGVTFHEINTEELKESYKSTAENKKFTFDVEWQKAVDEILTSVK